MLAKLISVPLAPAYNERRPANRSPIGSPVDVDGDEEAARRGLDTTLGPLLLSAGRPSW